MDTYDEWAEDYYRIFRAASGSVPDRRGPDSEFGRKVWQEWWAPVMENRGLDTTFPPDRKVNMKSRHPEYVNSVREDVFEGKREQTNEQLRGLQEKVRNQKLEITRLQGEVDAGKLWIHKLDSEKQTEACCTGEMRASYEREIEQLHRRLSGVRWALGPEWDKFFVEDAVAQLKKDHIESVKIADRVPELIRECNKLRADQFWYGGRESLEHAMRYESARAERLYKRTRLLADRLRMLGGFCHISSSKFAGQVLGGLYDEI